MNEPNNTEKKMDKQVKLEKGSYKIENGKVIIESEELANMIQEYELGLNNEEEAGANGICPTMC